MRYALVLVGLVVAIQYASANCCGCGIATAPFPCNCGCGLEGSGESMCQGTKDCVPMVVRPAEYQPSFLRGSGGGLSGVLGGKSAAEALAAAASALSFRPVPGPCITKKAIVKPAVLPKPVFRPAPPTCVCDCDHQNIQQSFCSSSVQHLGGCNGPTVNGIQRGTYSLFPGSSGRNGPYGPNGPHGVYGADGRTCADNQANCAAADAVSLSLAYKMAQQENYNHMANEDKLNFGFRKIPMELPVKAVPQNNVPEEKIFSLNGQIVELKPVKVGSSKSLAEEAAEELMALQEEEEEREQAENGASNGVAGGIRKVSLGELGYAPAKLSSPTFVNVPGSVVETAIDAVSSAVNEATGSSKSSSGCGCCGNSPTCKVIPGNVDYKILPKIPQVCITAPEPADSCESVEANISEEQPSNYQISCVPVCVQKQHNSCSHHRSSMSIQKIM